MNSFGIGGSNAHAIIESVKNFRSDTELEKVKDSTITSAPKLLLFSANSQDSLKAFSQESLKYQNQNLSKIDDFAYTLAFRREKLPYRSYAIVGNGITGEAAIPVKAPLRKQPLIMVFSGQGAQWPQMGKKLIENDVNFCKDIEEMDIILASLADAPNWTLKGESLFLSLGFKRGRV